MFARNVRKLNNTHLFRLTALASAIFMLLAVIAPGTILQIGETLLRSSGYPDIFNSWLLVLILILVLLSTLIGQYLGRRTLKFGH